MVLVRLSCVVGVLASAMQWVLGQGAAEASSFAVNDRNPDAEGTEIHSRNDRHSDFLSRLPD